MSTVDDQMKYHEMQAMWWMHSASNGHCEIRNVTNLGTNKKLTSDQLRADAMRTAQRHMKIFSECIDFKQNLEDKNSKTQHENKKSELKDILNTLKDYPTYL